MSAPVVVVHASLTAKRLELSPPGRSRDIFDALELFAFVRPARFCAPSAVGLALALGQPEPKAAEAQAASLRDVCALLLAELAEAPWPGREDALALAETLSRAGWAWGPAVAAALRSKAVREGWRGSGMDVWTRIAEWEDQAPPGEAGSNPVAPEAARARLAELLARAGLDEARTIQADFAAEAAYAFQPRDREGEPNLMLAEAGTGVGKTMGYLAPASLWAEANGPAVWVSTFTRALQRQIERESHAVYPDPIVRAKKAVVRKGRENYLCLLNLQEQANVAMSGGGDLIGLALAARWASATRDGDMTGGDFPGWLPGLFAVGAAAQAGPANLVDRRGECVHAACAHYRACFIEKAVRGSRRADLVIANHALVLTPAAFDGARAARGLKTDVETTAIKRIVFDEGHHLFDAADAAFSTAISGAEAAELRRWIRGPEGRGRRGRGLEQRLADLVGDREQPRAALHEAIRAASARIARRRLVWPRQPPSGEVNPIGPIEAFLTAALEQLRARAEPSDVGQECAARPALEIVRVKAAEAGSSAGGDRGAAERAGPALGRCTGRGRRRTVDR